MKNFEEIKEQIIKRKSQFIKNYIEKSKESNQGWKTASYFKIILQQQYSTRFKQQRYLNHKSSGTFLKFRSFTNGLKRYSYFLDENNSKFCNCCLKSKNPLKCIEDLKYFIWNCPKYENYRNDWKEAIKSNLNTTIQRKIIKAINEQDSLYLMSLANNDEFYEPSREFFIRCIQIRSFIK